MRVGLDLMNTTGFFLLAGVICTCASDAVAQTRRVTLPVDHQFANWQAIAVSPDGTRFVYAANNRLYSKTFDDKPPEAIAGTASSQPVTNPTFSPDGRNIAFWSAEDQSIKRIDSRGGEALPAICKANNPFGMSWEQGDVIVFGQGAGGVMRVSAKGGMAESIATVKEGEYAYGPHLLPGGGVLFTVINPMSAGEAVWDGAQIVLQPTGVGERRVIVEKGSDAHFLSPGYLVYGLSGALWAAPFDAKDLKTSGPSVKVLDDVRVGGQAGPGRFSFSENGTLAIVPGKRGQIQAALVDADGKRSQAGFFPDTIFAPRLSPDGKQVTFDAEGYVWTAALTNLAAARKLTSSGSDAFPLWSADGRSIVFISARDGGVQSLFRQSVDGSGDAELLVKPARAPESWSVPNQRLSFITLKGKTDYDIWTYSLLDKKGAPLIDTAGSAQKGSQFSHDGKWIAWESDESGRNDIYLGPFPLTGRRYQVTKAGGMHPLWSPDDKEIFFDNGKQLFAARVSTSGDVTIGDAVALPVEGFIQGDARRQYEMMPDGKQFLMMFPVAPHVDVIRSWSEGLKNLTHSRR